MKAPGELDGPMRLPVSYSKTHLRELKWCPERKCFEKKTGGVSRLDNTHWKDRGNRSRHYPS